MVSPHFRCRRFNCTSAFQIANTLYIDDRRVALDSLKLPAAEFFKSPRGAHVYQQMPASLAASEYQLYVRLTTSITTGQQLNKTPELSLCALFCIILKRFRCEVYGQRYINFICHWLYRGYTAIVLLFMWNCANWSFSDKFNNGYELNNRACEAKSLQDDKKKLSLIYTLKVDHGRRNATPMSTSRS